MIWKQQGATIPGAASCPETIPAGAKMLEKLLQMMLPLALIAMALCAMLLPWRGTV
ncbi:MAG: hypothetical protein ABI771_06905 [Betaproteobacteria bacterium]